MAARFEDEDDFIIELQFNNHKGHFDLYIHYWTHWSLPWMCCLCLNNRCLCRLKGVVEHILPFFLLRPLRVPGRPRERYDGMALQDFEDLSLFVVLFILAAVCCWEFWERLTKEAKSALAHHLSLSFNLPLTSLFKYPLFLLSSCSSSLYFFKLYFTL